MVVGEFKRGRALRPKAALFAAATPISPQAPRGDPPQGNGNRALRLDDPPPRQRLKRP
jgi:hypothetical protein